MIVQVADILEFKKNLSRISQHFYWPGIYKTVKDYVSTCNYCQRTGKRTDCTKQKYYHDKKARHREFEVGDMVLVLNPLRPSKLEVVWEGPGEIIQKVGNVNYLVKMLNSSKKPVMYHVNSLKMYRNRSANNSNCNNVGRKIERNVTDR